MPTEGLTVSSQPPPLPQTVRSPLPGTEPPPRSLLKKRYVEAIREELEARSGGCLNAAVLAVILLLAATLVFLPRALKMFRRWREERALVRPLREALRFAEAAEVVMALPLIVHSVLRQPGDKPGCGLFLISFDPEYANSIHRMADLLVLVGAGTSPSLSESDRAFCHALMDNERFVPFRRRRLPSTLTPHGTAYAVDVAMDPTLLAGRHLGEAPMVPCMAEPGDQGRILQMPYWLFLMDKSPDPAENVAFIEMVTSLEALRELGEREGGPG